MDHANPEAVKKHLRVAMVVFGALLVLTIVTVAASYLDLGGLGNIILALFIASVKASLVAAYFMHLISEKKLIYSVLILCVVFFIALLGLPLFHNADDLRM